MLFTCLFVCLLVANVSMLVFASLSFVCLSLDSFFFCSGFSLRFFLSHQFIRSLPLYLYISICISLFTLPPLKIGVFPKTPSQEYYQTLDLCPGLIAHFHCFTYSTPLMQREYYQLKNKTKPLWGGKKGALSLSGHTYFLPFCMAHLKRASTLRE